MVLKSLAVAIAILTGLFLIGRIPVSYNIRNLTVRWKTTVMTAFAFTAVVALLIVMMAFVHGMRRMTEETGQPGNVIVLADGATDEIISNLTIGDLSEVESLPEVVRKNGLPMASRETFLVASQSVPVHEGERPRRRFLQIRGIEEPTLTADIHGIGLLPGGVWFSDAGVQEAPVTAKGERAMPLVQAVVGEGVARELARDRTPEQRAKAKNPERLDVGDTFQLRDRTWLIVGVLNSGNMTFNSEIWAKRPLMASLFGKDAYTTLVLRTENADTALRLKEFLAKDYKKAAVNAQVETEYYKNLAETSTQFAFAVGFIAVVMSIGGIFGVMNTMFAAISQRINDIGVLRLLGYTRWHILVSFLLESLTIALFGGLLGCLLGSLTDGWCATSMVGGSHGGGKSIVLKLAISPDILATGILLSLLMGFLGGLLPAINAIRLKPLEALR